MSKQIRDLTEPDLKKFMFNVRRAIATVASDFEIQCPPFAVLIVEENNRFFHYVSSFVERSDIIHAFRQAADVLESEGKESGAQT